MALALILFLGQSFHAVSHDHEHENDHDHALKHDCDHDHHAHRISLYDYGDSRDHEDKPHDAAKDCATCLAAALDGFLSAGPGAAPRGLSYRDALTAALLDLALEQATLGLQDARAPPLQ
ncbi:MAG: hypothetical protein AAGH48_04350 [Pseudomonadota bacterium]